jgi:transposase InsO family protein
MQANKNRYTITEMARLFGIHRRAYYQWVRNGISQRRKIIDQALINLIRAIVNYHKNRYGSPRVRQELRKLYGKMVSLKKVARLMRENNLNSRRKGKFIPTTDSKHHYHVSENILDRNFYASKGGQKWVSDITYLRYCGGWVYLTIVLDLFDRRIIGWALSSSLDAAVTTIPAFEMAVKNRTPLEGLIFHSDRGVQYCAQSFREILIKRCSTVQQSMSRKGNCWDNACAESFMKTLKTEEEALDGKHTQAEVRQAVFYFIESYYNRIRMHSVLDNVAPNEYYLSKVA